MRILISLFLASSLAACTCNRADRPGIAPEDKAAAKRIQSRKAIKDRGMGRRAMQAARTDVPKTEASLWFIDEAKLEVGDDPWVEVKRQVGAKAPAKNAIWTLFKGPTPAETERGLVFINSGAAGFHGFELKGDTVVLQLRGGCDSQGGTTSVYDHISRTLKAFPEIKHVQLRGPEDPPPTEAGDQRPACLEP